MKKYLMLIILALSFTAQAQLGAFKVSSGSAIQIGYSSYRFLSLGISTSTPNNGAWAIEHWDNGLNFWKPYPTSGAGNYKLFISDFGAVGINMKPYTLRVPRHDIYTFKLQVNGRIAADGIWHWSDEKLKQDITDLDSSLRDLLALRPVSYHFKAAINIGDSIEVAVDTNNMDPIKYASCQNETIRRDTDESLHFGFIAQEIEVVFPNLVSEIGDIKAVNYVELIPVLVRAIQSQQKQIEDLKGEVQILKDNSLIAGVTNSKLYQNDPNPFNTVTVISYYIDENVTVTTASIEIRDLFGTVQKTTTLTDLSGLGSMQFDGTSYTDGFYVYTLLINGNAVDSKLLLINHP